MTALGKRTSVAGDAVSLNSSISRDFIMTNAKRVSIQQYRALIVI